MSEFSKRLKEKMRERQLSQSDLARKLKVTPTAVWNWENGHAIPRERSLSKLAQIFNVESDWLLGTRGAKDADSAIESIGDEIERMKERVAEINGVDVDRVEVLITLR